MTVLLYFCCSLVVWTNSTLWSTMTRTQMSTWWRTWAVWMGWVSPPLVSHNFSQPRVVKPLGSPEAPDFVPKTWTVGWTFVIRRLDFPASLDPLFSSHTSHPPLLLCCHLIEPLSQWNPELRSGRNHSLFSQSVSLGFAYCSQTNQSRTVQGPVTEFQHGCVFSPITFT